MSSTKDRIIELSNKIEEIQNQISSLSEQSWPLREEKEMLMGKYILEEKLLSQVTWELLRSDYKQIYLYLNPEDNGPENLFSDEISKLSDSEYHFTVKITDDVKLTFDDYEFSITFENQAIIPEFIKEHNIKVNIENFSDELNKLKEQISVLEELCNTYAPATEQTIT